MAAEEAEEAVREAATRADGTVVGRVRGEWAAVDCKADPPEAAAAAAVLRAVEDLVAAMWVVVRRAKADWVGMASAAAVLVALEAAKAATTAETSRCMTAWVRRRVHPG